MGTTSPSYTYPLPPTRRLRVYAFDPHASVSLSTAVINDAVIELPWEKRWETPLSKGPANEYIEVIDVDPASGLFYEPVDLNDPLLLAQDGLAPSEGRPQFHQQMVFAVAMRTIKAFERALGRPVLWARDQALRRNTTNGVATDVELNFTRTLRIYPHAIRERNAYYSPEKRALLFGYFRPDSVGSRATEANWIFTCLSQDIIAHETTHAILHGMQQRSIEASNADVLAFHEAFADIVALLQHFNSRDVVAHLLARSGGSLRTSSLLTGLAAQFGAATGKSGALRYALLDLLKVEADFKEKNGGGRISPSANDASAASVSAEYVLREAGLIDANPASKPQSPDAATLLAETTEVHARGGFLVAAVFDAFVTIYETRSADLFRLAGFKRGSLDLPLALVSRLADEAAYSAEHVLRMCVRALDYVPPVDLRFGEYLRAIITADTDLVPVDSQRYRVAFCEAFRKWGIRVPGCISMAPDSLLWDAPDFSDFMEDENVISYLKHNEGHLSGGTVEDVINASFCELLAKLELGVTFAADIDPVGANIESVGGSIALRDKRVGYGQFDREHNLRDLSMRLVTQNQKLIHQWFDATTDLDGVWDRLLGLRLQKEGAKASPALGSLKFKTRSSGVEARQPLFEVNSARISRRTGPDGNELHLLIIQITQKRRAYFDREEQVAADNGDYKMIGPDRKDRPDFWFLGGATLHVDLRDGKLLRIIRKRIDQPNRLEKEVAFRTGDESGTVAAVTNGSEPFAFMHMAEENESDDYGVRSLP